MISIKGLKRLKALALTILEKNGLEFFSDFFLKSLSIFSPKNKSLYEVKPVPNESPVTLLATHAKKIGSSLPKISENQSKCQKMSFFHSNEMEHHSNLCSKIEICPAQPILNQS